MSIAAGASAKLRSQKREADLESCSVSCTVRHAARTATVVSPACRHSLSAHPSG